MTNYPEIRAQLELEAQTLRSRLQKITGDLRQEDGALSADFEEQAVELENSEVLSALEDQTHRKLKQIEHTIERIENGNYGVCNSCGDDIALKRLTAIPYTTLCLSCAEEAEKSNA
ncbi:MAG: TraR/DksA family transcriptional regulator [Myxococcales bacterium]|nr:TraR/DksA family transcriptional regulator [Myxococcales bacterium]MCB9643955.1 TraR/DksA family transcriptional regulator [Myxococcales bacterium]